MPYDIRRATVLVIEKDGCYLSRVELFTGKVIWDQHLSSAWKTRNREKAKQMALKYGGQPVLFNPIIWKTKGGIVI